MKSLLASLALAVALNGSALPAFAAAGSRDNHADQAMGGHDAHGDHAVSAKGAHDGQGAHEAMFKEVGKRVLTTRFYRADVKLLDGRAHFAQLHAAHPGHAGIPTHRLTVDFKARSKSRVPKGAVVEVVAPSGKATQTDLWTEDGKLLADLELPSTGRYTFKLDVKERSGKRTLRWSETLK